eukprot:m.488915 g.488915  ORF g.488915 m.488915 type:complete len:151 (+) comp57235_c0_seq14:2073-2525(+)
MSGVLYHECGYVAGGVGEWRPLTLVPLPARAVLLSPTALTAYTTETRSGLTSRAFAFPNLTGTATCMEAWRDHQTGFNFLVVAGYEVSGSVAKPYVAVYRSDRADASPSTLAFREVSRRDARLAQTIQVLRSFGQPNFRLARNPQCPLVP